MPPVVDMLELLDRLIARAGLPRREVDRFSMLMMFNTLLEQEATRLLAAVHIETQTVQALAHSRQWNAPALWGYLTSLGAAGHATALSLDQHFNGDVFEAQMVDLLQDNFGPAAGVPDPDRAELPPVLVERLESHGWDRIGPALMKGVFRGNSDGRTQLVYLQTDGPGRYFLSSPVMETESTEVPQWILDIEVSYAWDMLADMIVITERLGAADADGPTVERIFARAEDIAFRADELESATGPEDRL